MQHLNYHHLYLFWTLSKEGTFTKTAKKLSISQSAVTSQIKSLEDVLELNLIDRSNKRKPILTEEGKTVITFATSIFEAGEELLSWTKQGTQQKKQSLKVGAISGISRNLQFEFLKPTLRSDFLQIEVVTGDQEKLIRLLKEHYLDIILSPHKVPSDGRVTLYSNILTTSPFVFVISKKYRLRNSTPSDYFSQKPIYLPGRSFDIRSEIDAFLDRYKFHTHIAGEIDDIALLRIFALRADAVVGIPKMGIQSEIDSGTVEIISQPKDIEQKFYVISRQKKLRNSIADDLIYKMRQE